MHPVPNAKSRAHGWLEAAKLLLEAREPVYNLVVEVDNPKFESPRTQAMEAVVDNFLAAHNCQPIETVSETIFPATEYKQGGINQVYRYADDVYPNIESLRANKWGTYAFRLVRRFRSDGKPMNPLELAIDKLGRQLKQKGPLKAVYELDMSLEPLELVFYNPEIDKKNTRGGQCLSHVSLKLGPNRELYLTALYRYQYFVQKALGNFRGLARLQDCIARELKIPVGPLVCHATMATLEVGKREGGMTPWAAADLKKLVRGCEIALGDDEEVREAA